jgi:hypothetical protein
MARGLGLDSGVISSHVAVLASYAHVSVYMCHGEPPAKMIVRSDSASPDSAS